MEVGGALCVAGRQCRQCVLALPLSSRSLASSVARKPEASCSLAVFAVVQQLACTAGCRGRREMMEIEESSCPSESGEEAGGGKDIRGSSVNSETSEKSR